MKYNNNVDEQYCSILKEIIEFGNNKITRAGETKSLFGKQMRFNLKDGFPLLTTKKVFMKGIIHELLWFLKGDTNIKYLIDNNVHIWDDDAYRWYCHLIDKNNEVVEKFGAISSVSANNMEQTYNKIEKCTKDVFLNRCLNEFKFKHLNYINSDNNEFGITIYKYGDLGPIYGKQWRAWSNSHDQISEIIQTLKNNPDDRRILLSAYNVGDLHNMALPPCHIMAQFYARRLNNMERLNWYCDKNNLNEYKFLSDDQLDTLEVPKYALSCMFFCRSQDFPLGTPFNIASYALLTHMIAQVCNMDVDELIWNGGDCHVYLNQIDSVKEQLKRKGYKKLPTLKLNSEIKNINDFKFDDIKIENYQSEDAIKIPLSVGL